MGGTTELRGDPLLRPLRAAEAALFAEWEKRERPYPWTAAQFHEAQAHASSHLVVLADPETDHPLGFLASQRIPPDLYISNLMIDPGRRREGWASLLLEKVMIGAEQGGFTSIWLDVAENNFAARALYQSRGFEVMEKRPHSYPHGETAWVMKKELGHSGSAQRGNGRHG